MTLSEFINGNLDRILAEWEAFALTLQPAAETMTALALRNHAKEILQAMARDIEEPRLPPMEHSGTLSVSTSFS